MLNEDHSTTLLLLVAITFSSSPHESVASTNLPSSICCLILSAILISKMGLLDNTQNKAISIECYILFCMLVSNWEVEIIQILPVWFLQSIIVKSWEVFKERTPWELQYWIEYWKNGKVQQKLVDRTIQFIMYHKIFRGDPTVS